MILTHSELEQLTKAYKLARDELGKNIVLIPASFKVYNHSTQIETTLLDMLRDIVYYNPNKVDEDGLKNMIIMNSPSLFQHNYPDLWDNMRSEYVDSDPLTSCMSTVFHAKKA